MASEAYDEVPFLLNSLVRLKPTYVAVLCLQQVATFGHQLYSNGLEGQVHVLAKLRSCVAWGSLNNRYHEDVGGPLGFSGTQAES